MSTPSDSPSKPGRMIVSLQVGGFFFALANVICVAILAWTYLSVKLEPKTIEVKGRITIDDENVGAALQSQPLG